MHFSINSRILRKAIVVSTILLALVVACTYSVQQTNLHRTTTPSAPTSLVSPLSLPNVSPLPHRAGLTGQLISVSRSAPLTNTTVRLARVFWDEQHTDGVYVLEGARSPSDVTDENGFFVFVDVHPGDYVMIVGDIYGDHVVISNPDGSARIFTLREGEVMELGQLRVTLP